MKIFLQGMAGEAASPLEVDPELTLVGLMKAIRMSDSSLQDMRLSLVFGETVVSDDGSDTSLDKLGITDGSTLQVTKTGFVEFTWSSTSDSQMEGEVHFECISIGPAERMDGWKQVYGYGEGGKGEGCKWFKQPSLYMGTLTLEEAKKKADELPNCVGFYAKGPITDAHAVDVFFKDAYMYNVFESSSHEEKGAYTSYVRTQKSYKPSSTMESWKFEELLCSLQAMQHLGPETSDKVYQLLSTVDRVLVKQGKWDSLEATFAGHMLRYDHDLQNYA